MYSDADIEMIEIDNLAADMYHASRNSTHEPTKSDLDSVYATAYQAAFYMNPIWECVTDRCTELEISPNHGAVQDAVFEASAAASKPDATIG